MIKKLIISFQIIKYSPLILFRYFKFSLIKKSLDIKEFRPISSYCIEGALNQLIWNVDNSLFVVLENTSKVYLGSNELIFKVIKDQTRFTLKSYGYNKIIQTIVNIQVIALNQKRIDSEILKSNFITEKKYNLRLAYSENIDKGLRKTSRFSFLKLKSVKMSKKIKKNVLKKYDTPCRELEEVNNIKP